jgi:hypothetical protein
MAEINYGGDATTGQVVGAGNGSVSYQNEVRATTSNLMMGGPCYIFAAAGTYVVSIQFKSTSGTVTVKGRKLWAWSMF